IATFGWWGIGSARVRATPIPDRAGSSRMAAGGTKAAAGIATATASPIAVTATATAMACPTASTGVPTTRTGPEARGGYPPRRCRRGADEARPSGYHHASPDRPVPEKAAYRV